MDFQHLFAQNGGVLCENRRTDGAMLIPNELVLTFGGCYLCATFWRKSIKKCDHESAHRERQTEFMICPMLYAIAMRLYTIFPAVWELKRFQTAKVTSKDIQGHGIGVVMLSVISQLETVSSYPWSRCRTGRMAKMSK